MDQVATPASERLARPISDVVLSETDILEPPTLLFADRGHVRESEDLVPLRHVGRANDYSEHSSRLLDILLAATLLVLTLPLMMFCALAIRLSGRGPVIFSQKRVGRFGKEFNCFKFRTMVPDAEIAIARVVQASAAANFEWGATQKLAHDPRITAVGRFLRRYCLDELPQLLNVLVGDMSIVGPRPIIAAEIVRYGRYFADYCSVRPGLTGLWQVSGKHALSYEERVRLDATYAKSKSIRTDLRLIWRTVPMVLAGKNM